MEDRKLAVRILGLEGTRPRLDDAVMATYITPGGKTFAWQVRFDMASWDDIAKALGIEVCERPPTAPAEKKTTKQKKTAKTRTRSVSSPSGSRRDRRKGT